MALFTYCMEIAFNGTAYCGWQRQTNGSISVQEVLENVLRRIFYDDALCVSACSRTDSGVHALCMTVSFRAEEKMDLAYLALLLEKQLPHNIRPGKIVFAPDGFNAHSSSVGKSYIYAVNTGYYNLFLKDACWSWPDVKSVDMLADMLPSLEGTHDFSSFTGRDMTHEDPVRTLYRVEMVTFGPVVCFYFAGNGFLYKMIRRIVGAFHEVAGNRMSTESFRSLLETPSRTVDAAIAPPVGLYLKKAFYFQDEWKTDSVEMPPFFF